MGHSASNNSNQYHIIWLDESLRHITWGLKPQSENMSTGLCAIQLALETGYDEIDVIGFSGLKDRNYRTYMMVQKITSLTLLLQIKSEYQKLMSHLTPLIGRVST